jgi:hydroxymethylpyrimidine/phosphomethylpyrimidine kinase
MSAITAITAQNTLGVTEVMPVPTDMVLAQIEAVVSDIGVDAVKIGMIGSAETAAAVADFLTPSPLVGEGRGEGIGRAASTAASANMAMQRADARNPSPDPLPQGERAFSVVFDPVMVATSGAVLADEATIAAFIRLMRIAILVTPNAPELAALAGVPVSTEAEMEMAALVLAGRHDVAVLAKGGHLAGDALVDLLALPNGAVRRWTGTRVETRHSHGTGCTLSSAIACLLGAGLPLCDAIGCARDYVRAALEVAPGLGQGHGPMGHGLGRSHFP